jgi:hypothetical protein
MFFAQVNKLDTKSTNFPIAVYFYVEAANFILVQALQKQGVLCSRKKWLEWQFYNQN